MKILTDFSVYVDLVQSGLSSGSWRRYLSPAVMTVSGGCTKSPLQITCSLQVEPCPLCWTIMFCPWTTWFLHKGLGSLHQSISHCNSFCLPRGWDFLGCSKQWAVCGSTVAEWCSSPKANNLYLCVSVSPKPRAAEQQLGTSVTSWIVSTLP